MKEIKENPTKIPHQTNSAKWKWNLSKKLKYHLYHHIKEIKESKQNYCCIHKARTHESQIPQEKVLAVEKRSEGLFDDLLHPNLDNLLLDEFPHRILMSYDERNNTFWIWGDLENKVERWRIQGGRETKHGFHEEKETKVEGWRQKTKRHERMKTKIWWERSEKKEKESSTSRNMVEEALKEEGWRVNE